MKLPEVVSYQPFDRSQLPPLMPQTSTKDLYTSGEVDRLTLGSNLEYRLKDYLKQKDIHIGAGHEEPHPNTSWQYAKTICTYLGNIPIRSWDLLHQSAVLHDLGRHDSTLHGQASIDRSVELATAFMAEIGHKQNVIDSVVSIIKDHDQIDQPPATLEGLILREADFLAGMGSEGIFRTIAWGAESGRTRQEIAATLVEGMPRRISSLRLPISRQIAAQLWPQTITFLSQLLNPYYDNSRTPKKTGRLIHLFGVSGSGKDTQADKISEYLTARNVAHLRVAEPTPLGKKMLREVKLSAFDQGVQVPPMVTAQIYAADRLMLQSTQVVPALQEGTSVISVRNYIDSVAYQSDTPRDQYDSGRLERIPVRIDIAQIIKLNSFALRPDIAFWFDVDPKIALRRISRRHLETFTPLSGNDNYERISELNETYKEVFRYLPTLPIVRINANGTPEDTFDQIRPHLKTLL
jgi:thymidylate kinase